MCRQWVSVALQRGNALLLRAAARRRQQPRRFGRDAAAQAVEYEDDDAAQRLSPVTGRAHSRPSVQTDVRGRREQWLPYYRRRQQDVARLRPRLTWTAEVGRMHQQSVQDAQTDLGSATVRPERGIEYANDYDNDGTGVGAPATTL